jgi:hypothetical protein
MMQRRDIASLLELVYFMWNLTSCAELDEVAGSLLKSFSLQPGQSVLSLHFFKTDLTLVTKHNHTRKYPNNVIYQPTS